MKASFYIKSILLLLVMTAGKVAVAQDTDKVKKTAVESAPSSYSKKGNYNTKAKELQNSLERKDDRAAADNYEDLGDENMKRSEYAQAEHNYRQALLLTSRQKNKRKEGALNRKLAQSQEYQNKKEEAIQNYNRAAATDRNAADNQLNFNDAARLQHANSTPAQRQYYQQNIDLLEKQGAGEELAEVYQQIAKVDMKENNTVKAKENLQRAIEKAKTPEQKTEIKQQLAEVLAVAKDYDEAIALSNKLLEEAVTQHNIPLQVEQLTQLSYYYRSSNRPDTSVALLEEAYLMAAGIHATRLARAVTDSLVSVYNSRNMQTQSAAAYRRFMADLDSLLIGDSSLVDDRIRVTTEARIQELEKEKELQGQIIHNKNRFNYFLLGSVVAVLVLLAVLWRSLQSIKTRNKRIALQALRREMNPHFIFNSLNSVNQFIAENNELEANKYLTSYSRLMRNVMENSNKDFVSMHLELEQLRKYLELEHMRFRDRFDYQIQVAADIDEDALLIPNMLIQPQLENAIWHGLRYKDQKGLLQMQVVQEAGNILVKIEDNGIGVEKSKAMKTTHQKTHQSIGLHNTQERITLLNQLYHTRIGMQMASDGNGTRVTFIFPVKHK